MLTEFHSTITYMGAKRQEELKKVYGSYLWLFHIEIEIRSVTRNAINDKRKWKININNVVDHSPHNFLPVQALK